MRLSSSLIALCFLHGCCFASPTTYKLLPLNRTSLVVLRAHRCTSYFVSGHSPHNYKIALSVPPERAHICDLQHDFGISNRDEFMDESLNSQTSMMNFATPCTSGNRSIEFEVLRSTDDWDEKRKSHFTIYSNCSVDLRMALIVIPEAATLGSEIESPLAELDKHGNMAEQNERTCSVIETMIVSLFLIMACFLWLSWKALVVCCSEDRSELESRSPGP